MCARAFFRIVDIPSSILEGMYLQKSILVYPKKNIKELFPLLIFQEEEHAYELMQSHEILGKESLC